ncbi:MAG: NAD(P)/FAD-dependent oxidoreductase [Vicinamibacteria bacterium]
MKGTRILVAGAGVMGLWTALRLHERGFAVTVVDPWEPGHPRGTSSSESRIIRSLYGSDPFYASWAWSSLAAWEKEERLLGTKLFHKTGVLWFAREEAGYEAAGEDVLRRLGIPVERLRPSEVAARFGGISDDGLAFAVFEPQAGAILAREAMRRLAGALERRGVTFVRGPAVPGTSTGGRMTDIECGGRRLGADGFVFACGPWLPQILSDILEGAIRVCRAEELYFGLPAGERRFDSSTFPTWVEIGAFYGIGALEGRGFKIGIDRPGDPLDPSIGERRLDPRTIGPVREYLTRRFPTLADAPLVDSRVCTYELTADEHLIIDRHPGMDNVWIAGGGSGHAFKLGPAIGEAVAGLVAGDTGTDLRRFRLAERAPRRWREA